MWCRCAARYKLSSPARSFFCERAGGTCPSLVLNKNIAHCLQHIISHYVDLDAADGHQVRPLHLAAINNHAAVVKALVDKGANVTKQDSEGDLPLHWAATKGHVEVRMGNLQQFPELYYGFRTLCEQTQACIMYRQQQLRIQNTLGCCERQRV